MAKLKKNKIFDAIKKIGQTPEHALETWLSATVIEDYLLWQILERKFGAKQALVYYTDIWEHIFLWRLDKIKKSQRIGKIDLKALGKISKAYWEEFFASSYQIVEETKQRHVGQMALSPFWDSLFTIYGQEAAIDFCNKTFPALIHCFQAVLKKLNVWDSYYLNIDKWIYLGDDVSRIIINKR